MNQNITNAAERRLSMLQFSGLFLVVLALCCFAFTRSFRLQKEIPKDEMDRLVKKQKVMQSLSELSDLLRQYEAEELSGSMNVEMKDAEVSEKMVTIRRQLLHEDTLVAYADVRKVLDMATQYRNFIKRTAKAGDQKTKEYEKQIDELKQQLGMSELAQKTEALKAQEQALQAAKKNNGSGAAAPPPIVYTAPPPTTSSPQPIIVPTQQNTGDANCDAKIGQIKTSFRQMCMQMRTSISQVRTDVNSISKGLFGKNSSEKQRIETNLQNMDKQLEANLIN